MSDKTTSRTKKRPIFDRLTVLDLFCGAGGFSEGFRSAGCRIVSGVDHWGPAVDTFNINFRLAEKPVDILSFEGNEQLIEQLPDTDIIIGSPPCVSFSYSNRLGNADKTEGLRLTKVFFAIVTVKKFKPGARLLAWYMENVANAMKWLPSTYSFADLGLSRWAKRHGFGARSIAIRVKENAKILNAADFGVAQSRQRLFVSELLKGNAKRRGFTIGAVDRYPHAKRTISSHVVRSSLPAPNCKPSSRKITDPVYPSIQIPLNRLTDHFYETGAYKIHWGESKLLKTSHPYMGRMAFPEKEDKPSRTVVATPSPRSREAMLYKSEWNRIGDGEYRGPTVREAATLMSFPITYQFAGSEGTKWKLVGNAVCPKVSRELAAQLLKILQGRIASANRKEVPKHSDVPNLNTFAPRQYDNPPKRRKLAKFRGHPFKAGGMTIALTNYDAISGKAGADGRWRCFVTYGIGEGYRIQRVTLNQINTIKRAIEKAAPHGSQFVEHVTNGFSKKIPSSSILQELYEKNVSARKKMLNPQRLLEEVEKLVLRFASRDDRVDAGGKLFLRKSVPLTQLYALFAVCHIVSTAEGGRESIQ